MKHGAGLGNLGAAFFHHTGLHFFQLMRMAKGATEAPRDKTLFQGLPFLRALPFLKAHACKCLHFWRPFWTFFSAKAASKRVSLQVSRLSLFPFLETFSSSDREGCNAFWLALPALPFTSLISLIIFWTLLAAWSLLLLLPRSLSTSASSTALWSAVAFLLGLWVFSGSCSLSSSILSIRASGSLFLLLALSGSTSDKASSPWHPSPVFMEPCCLAFIHSRASIFWEASKATAWWFFTSL